MPTVLTDGELMAMRNELERSLAGTAIVQTETWVSDGGGGGTTTWLNAGTAACRIAPIANPDEAVIGGRINPETEFIVTLPQATIISSDSQVEIDACVYTVTSLRAPRTWEISRRVEVKEVV